MNQDQGGPDLDANAPSYRFGFDIGGTFTDFVLIDASSGEISSYKTLTTPSDPSRAVMEGWEELLRGAGVDGGSVERAIHGTTLITNALIERKGSKTALITTKGFRDILEMAKEMRYDIYDLLLVLPEPLVARPLRLEVDERINARGEVLTPLQTSELEALAGTLKAEGVEAVAVCYLHAFTNPEHEQRTGSWLAENLPGVSVSLSSEVAPEIREYERMSTTVCNAYVQPLTETYLNSLQRDLSESGFAHSVYLMLSSGGITTLDRAARFPVRLVESGPAAGALAAVYYGDLTGDKDLVSFDMGGTTAKMCLIKDGSPTVTDTFEIARVHRFKRGSGLPVRVPTIELIEIGAGGGSIARIDELGLLKVGPESAGADPGPACYGQGGTEPTVTDADVLLGYLNPDYFLGGRMSLDKNAAEEAIRRRIAEPMGLSVTDAAHGLYRVVNENMISATRVHVAERGADARRLKLIAFGGAGPVHADAIARALKMQGYICPARAGVASAIGFLTAPASFEFARTTIARLDPETLGDLDEVYAELEEQGRQTLLEAGVPEGEMTFTRQADLRHVGQGHEIVVTLPYATLADVDLDEDLRPRFYRAYEEIYGHAHPHLGLEITTCRLTASGPPPAGETAAGGGRGRRPRGGRQGPPPGLLRGGRRLRRHAPVRPLHALGGGDLRGPRDRRGDRLHRRHRARHPGHRRRLREPGRRVHGRMSASYRFGFDIGGTFTDFVLIDASSGEISSYKTLTTPSDPSRAVMEGWEELLRGAGVDGGSVERAIHGTTLITNALIERKGAVALMLTTRGFSDVLDTQKEMRYDIYDLHALPVEHLIPRPLRFEVDERIDTFGDVLEPLDPAGLEEMKATLAEAGVTDDVEAVAVCLLQAYTNAEHEQQIGAWLAENLPGVSVSLSSEVAPQIREYERMSTTVCNAYVQPLTERYLKQIEESLRGRGFGQGLYLMLSSGGVTTLETAARFPVRLVESGPAAGALAAAFYGNLTGDKDLVSFDMGGTTAKMCVITGGSPTVTDTFEIARVHRFKRGSGLPVRVPTIEMIEIGAGGGSIARIDELGLLKVGPESAGADPGPACYGQGGEEPTVTDADLLLGYLNPDYFLGGRMSLDVEAAERAMARLAEPLGLSVTDAAHGLYRVVNENMISATRVHIAEQGGDPRRLKLIAFGGAGPMHAHAIAQALKMEGYICPASAGVASAMGFLTAPAAFEYARTFMDRLEQSTLADLDEVYAELEEQGRQTLLEAGVPEGEMTFTRQADLRHVGQGYEIVVTLPHERLAGVDLESELKPRFFEQYEAIYGHAHRHLGLEITTCRLTASGPKPNVSLKPIRPEAGGPRDAVKGTRRVFFAELGGFSEVPLYDRSKLSAGATFEGPAIVEEIDSTAVVGPGTRVEIDRYANLNVTFVEVEGS